ncbi:MAG TPA: hypothetical protein VGQ83_36645 [Polyangia bacterium]|jgi:hypothetical protein
MPRTSQQLALFSRSALLALALVAVGPGLARAATIHVPADHGTIAAAMLAAAPGDTIDIAAGTYTEGDLTIAKDLRIQGQGAGVTIVQAAATPGVATTRVFTLGAGSQVTIADLTVRHGRALGDEASAAEGGGIYAFKATLTLDGVAVTDNQAACVSTTSMCSDSRGGGVYAALGATTIVNSTIANNRLPTATCAGTCNLGSVEGGGLYTDDAVIGGSTISGNAIAYPEGAMAYAHGGGIYGRSIQVIDSTVSGNTSPQSGAGIYIWGYGAARLEATTGGGGAAAEPARLVAGRRRGPLLPSSSAAPTNNALCPTCTRHMVA